MIFNMSGGGGGVGLNFKIVGNPQPSNPAENTIWVDTDTEITGWAFNAEEPDGAEGKMWIKIGTLSNVDFNALKKNDLTVHPMSAKQYINGAWQKVTCQSYQDGAWVEWMPEGSLYWYGNECTNVTGGWLAKTWQMQSDATGSASTTTFEVARNDDYIEFTKTGTFGAVLYAQYPIDLTNVNTIHFKGEMYGTGRNWWCAFHVWTKLGGSYWASNSVATVNAGTSGALPSFALDVSNLSGNHYIGFGIYDPANKVKLEELYLEVAE